MVILRKEQGDYRAGKRRDQRTQDKYVFTHMQQSFSCFGYFSMFHSLISVSGCSRRSNLRFHSAAK